jgi:hypothetical protein
MHQKVFVYNETPLSDLADFLVALGRPIAQHQTHPRGVELTFLCDSNQIDRVMRKAVARGLQPGGIPQIQEEMEPDVLAEPEFQAALPSEVETWSLAKLRKYLDENEQHLSEQWFHAVYELETRKESPRQGALDLLAPLDE